MSPETSNKIPFISVVIPHFNNFGALSACLASLRRQSWPANHYEIVVADNNSTGGVARVREIAPDVQIVAAREQGAGPARNAGAAASRGDVIAFIDCDCWADTDWLLAGVEGLRRFDYIGGAVVVERAACERMTPAEAYELVFAFHTRKYVERARFAATANLFVPREIFVAVGGFRNGLSEDMDWCWRANALGYRLGYVEEAMVRHAPRDEWRALIRKWDRVIAEHYLLDSEKAGWRWRWLVHTALVLASPLPHALHVLASAQLRGTRDKLIGIAGLFAIRSYRGWKMVRYLFRQRRPITAPI